MARTLTADHLSAIDAFCGVVEQFAAEYLERGESAANAQQHAIRTVRMLLRENLRGAAKAPGRD